MAPLPPLNPSGGGPTQLALRDSFTVHDRLAFTGAFVAARFADWTDRECDLTATGRDEAELDIGAMVRKLRELLPSVDSLPPGEGHFHTLERQFYTSERQFHISEEQFHTPEGQFHTPEGQFHTPEGQFHTREEPFSHL